MLLSSYRRMFLIIPLTRNISEIFPKDKTTTTKQANKQKPDPDNTEILNVHKVASVSQRKKKKSGRQNLT